MPLNLCLSAQELQDAEEGTQLVVDTLHWAGPTCLLASCSLWLNGVQQVGLGPDVGHSSVQLAMVHCLCCRPHRLGK